MGKGLFKIPLKRSTPMVDGSNQSLAGSSEIKVWNYRNGLNLAKSEERERKKNIFTSFLLLREIGSKKNQGLKNGGWENRRQTWLPRAFLGGGGEKFRVSRSDSFLFTNVFFLHVEKYHLDNLGSSFYPFLTAHLIWDAYDTRSRKHLDQEGLRKISALSATIACWVQS